MKVLVTGDRGYIGSALVPLLIQYKFDVVGIDTNYYNYTYPLHKKDQYSYKKITKDIRNIEKKDLESLDAIVHLSALSNDPIGELNPGLTDEINCKASIRLAEIAKEVGVKRFIFASSCSVYGGNGEVSVTEEDPVDPLTPYAKSKVNTEKALQEMASVNFSPVYLRNSTVYGYAPKLRLDLVVNNLVAWALTTGTIKLMSDGKAWRPLVHVHDLARFFWVILKAEKNLIHNQIFNVGSDEQNYLISDIANEIHQQMPDCTITFGPGASTDKRNYRVNFSKLKTTFSDFMFKMNISSGISELIKVIKENGLSFEDFSGAKYIRLIEIKDLITRGKVDKDLYWFE